MKFEAKMLLVIALFFFVLFATYAFLSKEWAGSIMLLGSVLLGLLPGSYYLWWSNRMEPRPEDRDDATIKEGSGVIAAFPDTSIWPFIFGVGAAMFALSLVLGIWTAFIGGAMTLSAMIGVATESRRGGQV